MYCSSCGTPITGTLSFCSRCGIDLRERVPVKNTAAIIAFLSAMTLLGIGGMGIMLFGALILRKEAGLPPGIIAFFLFFIFSIVVLTEILLVRTLSRITNPSEPRQAFTTTASPLELRPAAVSSFAETFGSVTDNTTRTLEYAPRER